MFFFLCSIIPWTLNPTTFEERKKENVPLVVRFSSEHVSKSIQMKKDWDYFSKMYENDTRINIAHVNCGKYRRLCIRENEWEYPTIKLFLNNSVFKYDGGMSHDSLASWVSKITGVAGTELNVDLLSPNNKTFHQLVKEKKCVFSMFYTPSNKEVKDYIPEMNSAARAFHSEEDISVCEIDVDKFKSFFFDMKFKRLPKFMLFTGKEKIKYTGHASAKDIVDFVDEYCDKKRTVDGTLNNEAGIMEELDEYVKFFVKEPKESTINQVKEFIGSDVYVDVMQNVMQNGKEWLHKEDARLDSLIKSIKEKNPQDRNLDDLQIRSNIISVFMSFL